MSGRFGSGMRYLWPCLLVGGLAIVGIFASYATARNSGPEYGDVSPYRMHYAWTWTNADYASGYSDEVAASYILLEANGLAMTKSDLSLRMGEDEGGEPASSVALRLNRALPVTDVAVPIAYDYIQFLPAPSIIWIFDGVGARPVVFLCADEAQADIADPRNGVVTYGFTELSQMYDGAGRQAVCIADRGYTTLTD